jgi:hypothetical protein
MIPPVGKMAIVFGDVFPSALFAGFGSAKVALPAFQHRRINILHRI